jgi:hypothetical protein
MPSTDDGAVQKCPLKKAVPLIFVPGIMGSRLRNAATKEVAWNPSKTQGLDWWWTERSPAERRQILVGGGDFSSDFLEVNDDNWDMEGSDRDPKTQKRLDRGWGGVAWMFYGGILKWLDGKLASELRKRDTKFSHVRFTVVAHPYNWTDDNRNAGTALVDTVAKAKEACEADWGGEYTVLDPIIISHSMGGLVSRAFAVLENGAGSVQGIIHGAMPTHGSPAAYKRMRAGFEGGGASAAITRTYLGETGREVTALLANMPGGLELLPNQLHRSGDGSRVWLRASLGARGDILALPTQGNPYGEIYAERDAWWRLANPAWVRPGSADSDAAWGGYLAVLGKAEDFHAELGEKFHPTTYMSWSNSRDHLAWDEVDWQVQDPKDLGQFKQKARALLKGRGGALKDDAEGTLSCHLGTEERDFWFDRSVELEVEIAPADAPGDGTVHAGSGRFVADAVESEFTIEETWLSGDQPAGYAHDAAYDNDEVRTQVCGWIAELLADKI